MQGGDYFSKRLRSPYFDSTASNLESLDAKIDSYGGDSCRGEDSVGVPPDNAGFADSRVPNEDYLEQIVVFRFHCLIARENRSVRNLSGCSQSYNNCTVYCLNAVEK